MSRLLPFVWYFMLSAVCLHPMALASAQVGGGTTPRKTIATQQILGTAGITSVQVNPASVIGGAQVSGTIVLGRAAPAAGVTITLHSSNSGMLAVPQSVIIPAGATSATFIAQTSPVSVNPNVVAPPPAVHISAQMGSSPPTVVTVTVLPPALTALTLSPATVGGGSKSTGTVTITGPAPAGGLPIAISSKSTTQPTPTTPRESVVALRNQSHADMPSQVVVPAGATSASFAIATKSVSSATAVQVNASWGALATKSATLTLVPPDVASIDVTIGGETSGGPRTVKVTLTAPAPADGMTINLSTALAYGGTTGTFAQCGQLPSAPSSVTIGGGNTSVTFPVAIYPGYGVFWLVVRATSAKQVGLYTDAPTFKAVLPSGKGGRSVQGSVQLSSPAMSVQCGNRYQLASSNTALLQVPAYVDVPPGATQAAFTFTTAALPSTAGTQTVTITATGKVIAGGAPANVTGVATTTTTVTITP